MLARRLWAVAMAIVLLAVLAGLAQQTARPGRAGAEPQGPPPDATVENNVAVPMRDGVVLRANIWRPRADGKFPVLIYRTPYNKDEAAKSYSTFRRAVERGYVVVMQDVRGRYASDGEFWPYENEGRDGYDTIEWAARQPWSNGEIGTFGLSYPGAVQWLAAVEHPPHLKAMVPAMTFSSGRNFFYSGGVFDLSWPYWIWANIAPDIRVRKKLPGPKTYKEAVAQWPQVQEKVVRTLPLSAMEELKDVAPFYYEWLQHPPEDRYWDFAEIRGKYDGVNAAVLNLSGWYDEAYGPEGAWTNFAGLAQARKGQPLRTALLIGPWVHGVSSTASTKSGEREFGPSARIDYDEVVLRWMDHYLRGIDNGVNREPAIRLYLMGANQWREYTSWPPRVQQQSWYLQPRRQLTTKAPEGNSFTEFLSDPAAPVVDPNPLYSGAHDYRALAERSDVVVFDSDPLPQDLDAMGPIRAEIYLSVDAPDTDLWVRVMDVGPNGAAYNLMSPGLDVMRASYRDGKRRRLLKPNRIYRLDFTNLMTGNRFGKGHRIRVQLSTSFLPHFSRNLHTGELETISGRMRKAKIRIYHDRRHASRIVLPVIAAEAQAQ